MVSENTENEAGKDQVVILGECFWCQVVLNAISSSIWGLISLPGNMHCSSFLHSVRDPCLNRISLGLNNYCVICLYQSNNSNQCFDVNYIPVIHLIPKDICIHKNFCKGQLHVFCWFKLDLHYLWNKECFKVIFVQSFFNQRLRMRK